LMGDDLQLRLECARAWSKWEGSTACLLPNPVKVGGFDNDQHALAFARIENHYFYNGGFMKTDGQLLENVDILEGIPVTIVQGRYDCVCPAVSAWELHKAWRGSKLEIIDDAGHAVSEPGITSALIKVMDDYKNL